MKRPALADCKDWVSLRRPVTNDGDRHLPAVIAQALAWAA